MCSKRAASGQVTAPPRSVMNSRGASLDHLVGALLEKPRHVEAKRLGGLEIDDKVELGRLFDWKVSRLRPLENAVDIEGGAVVLRRNWARRRQDSRPRRTGTARSSAAAGRASLPRRVPGDWR